MIYVLIDTSIFVKTWTHSCRCCEITDLIKLGELVDSGIITILFPDVINLELQKNWRSFSSKLKKCISDVKSKIEIALKQQGAVWNEADAIREAIPRFCDTWGSEFSDSCAQRHDQLRDFLASKAVFIPFTQETMFYAKRLMISGAMSRRDRDDQDAFIVQSVIEYLNGEVPQDDFLYFCTKNTADFTVSIGTDLALRIGVREQLPASSFFLDLQSLYSAAKQHLRPVEPAPADVQDAEDKEELLREVAASVTKAIHNDLGSGLDRVVASSLENFRVAEAMQNDLVGSGLDRVVASTLENFRAAEAMQNRLVSSGLDRVVASTFENFRAAEAMQNKLVSSGLDRVVASTLENFRVAEAMQNKLASSGLERVADNTLESLRVAEIVGDDLSQTIEQLDPKGG